MTIFNSSAWIVAPIIIPLIGGLLCFLWRRDTFFIALFISLANLLSVTTLLRQFLLFGPLRYRMGGWEAPLGIALRLHGPALLMLLMTAVSGIGITLYARGYFSFRISALKHNNRHEQQERFFWPLWLMLWTALNALFLSGDIFNLYVTLELVSVSAAALAALSGKPASQIAAFRYLLVSLLGSLSYLLGVVFVYKTYGILDLEMLRQIATPGPGLQMALTLMTLGLLLKTALFPLHFWLPPAHANALAPVSAILSGLVVKGSFFILFTLWFEIFASSITANALDLIGLLGAGAVIWGSLQAIRQQRLKLLVTYSTVAQLGYLFIAFPLTATENISQEVWTAVTFMVMAHSFAKTAMFMAAGTIFLQVGHDRIRDLAGIRKSLPITSFAYAIAGVNLIGLPPSGGFIGKWLLLTAALTSGQWHWSLVIIAGSLLASVYVFRVVSRLFLTPDEAIIQECRPHSPLQEWPALFLAIIALLLGLIAPYFSLILETTEIVANLAPGGGL
ncbi:MAG: oxidoreductase [Proteobacteria bacterium]|nr:oxidoreductase [Pseudomonadota bacterium]MBU1716716.1 oxidoreductase [Pseudomonadota bacterium]